MTQPEIKPGLLEAMARAQADRALDIGLLTLLAGGLAGALASIRDAKEWPSPALVAVQVHKYARAVIVHEPDAVREQRRQERLAELGQHLVDLAFDDFMDIECPFCDGKLSGPHDEMYEGGCPIFLYERDYPRAKRSDDGTPPAAVSVVPAAGPMTGPERGRDGEP